MAGSSWYCGLLMCFAGFENCEEQNIESVLDWLAGLEPMTGYVNQESSHP